jgi:putative membrane-bound dehydrogenase-like protein
VIRLLSYSMAGATALCMGVAVAGPLSPAEALRSFDLADDLAIELVAAEPLIESPCAMAFDERGRLFVTENRGYPIGPKQGEAPVGRVTMLEDTDGDGRMDRRTTFADGLTFPNGVMPWKGGLIVTCAPDLLFLRDTDNDGRADERRVLLTGFDDTKSTQLRVNAPLLGPDGWIWLASGLSGGKITNPEHPEYGALELKTDLRYDPENGRFEAVDGRSQYGHSFDDFGQRFICMNRIQVQHVVLSAHAFRRNPHLAFADTVQNCPELVPNPLLRGGGGAARIFPISANITTADSHAGTFSAACAVTIWPGGALPPQYRGAALSCDSTGNLVHVDRLEPRGATYAAVSMFKDREFLASRDDWFRPVFLATGPDGALYVCDMYRKVIEHPDYLPQEVRKHTDFEAGKDMGRIWRISRKTERAGPVTFPPYSGIEPMLARLGSENGWERQTVFRLLVERKRALTEVEVPVIASTSAPSHAAAMLALFHQAPSPNERLIEAAVDHADASVRALAIRLSNQGARSLRAANDLDARVRLQAALRITSEEGKAAVQGLAEIARRDGADRWARAAILSSAAKLEEELAAELMKEGAQPDLMLLRHLGQIIGKRVKAEGRVAAVEALLKLALRRDGEVAIALSAGLVEALGALPKSEVSGEIIASALARTAQANAIGLLAIELLGATSFETAGPALVAALDLKDPSAQLAAVRALARLPEKEAAALLLQPERWRGLSPALRDGVLSALGSRPRTIEVLLTAVETGAISASAIDSLRRNQWQKHADADIRERATKLFSRPANGDRQRAFTEAKAVLTMTANATNGRDVFRKLCASCHRIEREGAAVGPDLFDIRNQPKESILLHIVVPEHEIAPGFSAYIVETEDGRTLAGVISSETPESIKLRQPGGQEETISRPSVKTITESPVSLMPPGMETAMTQQELADLLSYLRGEQ